VGHVSIASSTIGDPAFEQEVVGKVATWHFRPVPDSLGAVTVTYPFEFYEER
jgi:outer membrane biosynthesis protein TonB